MCGSLCNWIAKSTEDICVYCADVRSCAIPNDDVWLPLLLLSAFLSPVSLRNRIILKLSICLKKISTVLKWLSMPIMPLLLNNKKGFLKITHITVIWFYKEVWSHKFLFIEIYSSSFFVAGLQWDRHGGPPGVCLWPHWALRRARWKSSKSGSLLWHQEAPTHHV